MPRPFYRDCKRPLMPGAGSRYARGQNPGAVADEVPQNSHVFIINFCFHLAKPAWPAGSFSPFKLFLKRFSLHNLPHFLVKKELHLQTVISAGLQQYLHPEGHFQHPDGHLRHPAEQHPRPANIRLPAASERGSKTEPWKQ